MKFHQIQAFKMGHSQLIRSLIMKTSSEFQDVLSGKKPLKSLGSSLLQPPTQPKCTFHRKAIKVWRYPSLPGLRPLSSRSRVLGSGNV